MTATEAYNALREACLYKPFGSYLKCKICGGTWWSDQRESHAYNCEARPLALTAKEARRD